jgi:hypothetical protein
MTRTPWNGHKAVLGMAHSQGVERFGMIGETLGSSWPPLAIHLWWQITSRDFIAASAKELLTNKDANPQRIEVTGVHCGMSKRVEDGHRPPALWELGRSPLTMFCIWNWKRFPGRKFCPDSSLIVLITWRIEDLIYAKTYFFLLEYFFSHSVNILWKNKVPYGHFRDGLPTE